MLCVAFENWTLKAYFLLDSCTWLILRLIFHTVKNSKTNSVLVRIHCNTFYAPNIDADMCVQKSNNKTLIAISTPLSAAADRLTNTNGYTIIYILWMFVAFYMHSFRRRERERAQEPRLNNNNNNSSSSNNKNNDKKRKEYQDYIIHPWHKHTLIHSHRTILSLQTSRSAFWFRFWIRSQFTI